MICQIKSDTNALVSLEFIYLNDILGKNYKL